MKDIFNASYYIETMKNYPNIKLFKLSHMTSSEPEEDLLELDPLYKTWTSADKNNVELFSAVCLLTARFMADTLGQNKVSYLYFKNMYIIIFKRQLCVCHLQYSHL